MKTTRTVRPASTCSWVGIIADAMSVVSVSITCFGFGVGGGDCTNHVEIGSTINEVMN
jgi:hypothetical protein